MSKLSKSYSSPTHEEIATYAYYLWEAEGRRPGRDQDYWLQAEAQLAAHRRYEAGPLKEMPERLEKKATGRIAADARPKKIQAVSAGPVPQFA